jgi:hypothetical protein
MRIKSVLAAPASGGLLHPQGVRRGRLGQPFSDGGPEARCLFDEAQGGFFDEVLGVDTGVGGDLGELRFLLVGEMDFHRFEGRNSGWWCRPLFLLSTWRVG